MKEVFPFEESKERKSKFSSILAQLGFTGKHASSQHVSNVLLNFLGTRLGSWVLPAQVVAKHLALSAFLNSVLMSKFAFGLSFNFVLHYRLLYMVGKL